MKGKKGFEVAGESVPIIGGVCPHCGKSDIESLVYRGDVNKFDGVEYILRCKDCGWLSEPYKKYSDVAASVQPKADVVNHPSHYTDGKIEVIDFIEDKKLNFHRGNAVKYIARAGKKNPEKEIEDLEKARWYIDREIKRLGGGNSN